MSSMQNQYCWSKPPCWQQKLCLLFSALPPINCTFFLLIFVACSDSSYLLCFLLIVLDCIQETTVVLSCPLSRPLVLTSTPLVPLFVFLSITHPVREPQKCVSWSNNASIQCLPSRQRSHTFQTGFHQLMCIPFHAHGALLFLGPFYKHEYYLWICRPRCATTAKSSIEEMWVLQ